MMKTTATPPTTAFTNKTGNANPFENNRTFKHKPSNYNKTIIISKDRKKHAPKKERSNLNSKIRNLKTNDRTRDPKPKHNPIPNQPTHNSEYSLQSTKVFEEVSKMPVSTRSSKAESDALSDDDGFTSASEFSNSSRRAHKWALKRKSSRSQTSSES